LDSTPTDGNIVLLGGDKASTRMVYHALAQVFPNVQVILEAPIDRMQLLRRRARRLGLVPVIDQVLFMLLLAPLLRRQAAHRIAEIKRTFHLNDAPIPPPVFRVPSVNASETPDLLRQLHPCIVLVNGTRIIGTSTLTAIAAPFVNMHAGITPRYRGAHGGYWALYEGYPEFAGTTIHFIDEGIDTGTIIHQQTFDVTPEDSFATYPYLHLATGIPMLIATVQQWLNVKEISCSQIPLKDELPSRLYYNPTLCQYLLARWLRGTR
jgi:hypothetical protein